MTDSQGLPVRRRILAVASISIGAMMLMIDASISSVVLPTIATALGVANSSTLLVVTVYQLMIAMTLLPLAAVGVRVGYRRMYQAGFVLHICSGLLCLLVDNLPALIAVRALQSLAAAAAMAVGVAMVRQIYPPKRLGSGLALNTIFNATGTALAPVLGGYIAAYADWHWTFVAGVPLAMISLGFSRFLPDPIPHNHPFDTRGAALCSLTFGLFIGGIEGAVHTSYVTASLTAVALSVVSGWLLVRHERREDEPVLPVDLLTRPALGLTTLATLLGTISSMVIMLSVPFRLQLGYEMSTSEIGSAMAAYALASVMFAPLSGALSDRVPVPLLCTVGLIIASIGMASVALLPAESPGTFAIAWRLWLCGAGFGFFFAPNARLLVGSAPQTRAAAAGSLFTTTRMLAMAVSATLVAGLLAMDFGKGAVPMLVAAALAVITAAISVTILRMQKKSASA